MPPSVDPPSPKEIVRTGWNRASRAYRPDGATSDAFGHSHAEQVAWLEPFHKELAPGARVLDLGCGTGVPVASALSERFQVWGVDISETQIERARSLVPRAEFLRADMTELRFPARAFTGVVCLYALIHVPVAEQRPLLERIFDWLEPGGLFLLVTGSESYTGTESDWLGSGATMYWSQSDAVTYRGWFESIGFVLVHETTVPEGEHRHELFLLRRPRERAALSSSV
jgi:SAM-dependent methyltransferase